LGVGAVGVILEVSLVILGMWRSPEKDKKGGDFRHFREDDKVRVILGEKCFSACRTGRNSVYWRQRDGNS
jgi:hypothetical protein